MRGVQTIDFDPANVSAVEIANEVEVAAVGVITITALAAAPGVARQISFDNETATEENASATLVIVGTDADGNIQQETITNIPDSGEDSGITQSVKFYNTVSSITVGGTLSTDIVALNIGTNGVMASKAIMLDKYAVNAPLVVQELTGTMAWGLEVATEVLDNSKNQGDVVWTDDADHSGISASQQQNLADWPVTYLRVKTSSYTDTAELALRVSQGY
jgi:hypothetical protein